jgi:hypothetical protein
MAALTLASAGVFPWQGWWTARSGRGVVLERAMLEGSDVELDPGQMVRVRERRGDRVRVTAGRVIGGWVSKSAVESVAPARGEDG